MEAHKPRKQLGLDTNVLLDLAEGADFACDFKETFQNKGYVLRLPPMVVAPVSTSSCVLLPFVGWVRSTLPVTVSVESLAVSATDCELPLLV